MRSLRIRAQLLGGTIAILCSLAAAMTARSGVAAELASTRYQISGTASMSIDTPIQKNGGLQLKAVLAAHDTSVPSSMPMQNGGRFALTARASSVALVCYNDTIFRDDFDGDGG